jgi:SAM-dependent methyltransferase
LKKSDTDTAWNTTNQITLQTFSEYNKYAWDIEVRNHSIWTCPVSSEVVAAAKKGDWQITLTPSKAVPRDWFPEPLTNKKVLCLASGGGQQGPILAAAGANVTVFDISPEQLKQDMYVAERDNLLVCTELGNMKDLSRFSNEYFDLIIHPLSNCFIDDIIPVWNECYRVLKKGGSLLSGVSNPIQFIFDLEYWNSGKLVIKNKIPYSDLNDITPEEIKELIIEHNEAICFGHSLHDQIQGQINAGFIIAGLYEDNSRGNGPLDPYIDSFIATRALKLKGSIIL